MEGLSAPGSLGQQSALRDLLTRSWHCSLWGRRQTATLRALSRITATSPTDVELKSLPQAMETHFSGPSPAFRSLFRAEGRRPRACLRNLYRPEVQGGDNPYWRRVLAYAIEGGLSAVLDEYFHVIRDSGRFDGSAADLREACLNAQPGGSASNAQPGGPPSGSLGVEGQRGWRSEADLSDATAFGAPLRQRWWRRN